MNGSIVDVAEMKFQRRFHYFEARADNGNLAAVTIAGVDTLKAASWPSSKQSHNCFQ
jgi:hypothetical protein